MSKAVKEFLDLMGTKKYTTTPYKPTSNGSVERFHRYLNSAIYFALKTQSKFMGRQPRHSFICISHFTYRRT